MRRIIGVHVMMALWALAGGWGIAEAKEDPHALKADLVKSKVEEGEKDKSKRKSDSEGKEKTEKDKDKASCSCPSGIRYCICSDGSIGRSGCDNERPARNENAKMEEKADTRSKKAQQVTSDSKLRRASEKKDEDKPSAKEHERREKDAKDKKGKEREKGEIGVGGVRCGAAGSQPGPRGFRSILGQ